MRLLSAVTVHNKSKRIKEHIDIATKLTEYIASKSTKPDACFVGDSSTAAIFINHLLSKGIKVPDDIAVVGYDYTPVAETAMVPLTTVEQPVDIIIDEAVEIAKELGSESSPSFINGVLGTILQEKNE